MHSTTWRLRVATGARSIAVMAALLTAALPGASRADPDEAPSYSLRQATPSTGTNIPKNIVSNGTIPYNKTYAELTPEQQDRLKSQYEGMGVRDEPPFPVRGLAPLYRAVADGQQRRLASGELSILLDIDANGDPVAASIYQTPDDAAATLRRC